MKRIGVVVVAETWKTMRDISYRGKLKTTRASAIEEAFRRGLRKGKENFKHRISKDSM